MISDFEFNKRAHLRQVSQKLNQNNDNGPISEAKAKKRKLPKSMGKCECLEKYTIVVLLVFFSGVNLLDQSQTSVLNHYESKQGSNFDIQLKISPFGAKH